MTNLVNTYLDELIKNYVPVKHTLSPDLLYKYFRALPIYYDASQFHYKCVSFTMFRNKDGIIIYPEFRPSVVIPFTQLKSLIENHFKQSQSVEKPVNCQISMFDVSGFSS